MCFRTACSMPYTTHVHCSFCAYKTKCKPTLEAAFKRAQKHEREHHVCERCGYRAPVVKDWWWILSAHCAQCTG